MIKRLEYIRLNEYRWRHPNGSYRYYEIRVCHCGEKFLAGKYNKVIHCSMICKGSTRGRPIGYSLNQYSKDAIAIGRKGQKQSAATKEKLSEAMTGKKYVWSVEGWERWFATHRGNPLLWNTGKLHPRHKDYVR